jgi:hypothetical protein
MLPNGVEYDIDADKIDEEMDQKWFKDEFIPI